MLTLLSRVSAEARGAVLGLNITFSSLGWIGATVVGGLVVSAFGFGALGLLTFGFGMAGACLALTHWLWPSPHGARLSVAPNER